MIRKVLKNGKTQQPDSSGRLVPNDGLLKEHMDSSVEANHTNRVLTPESCAEAYQDMNGLFNFKEYLESFVGAYEGAYYHGTYPHL